MTDLTITTVGDAWVNSARTGVNYGSTAWVRVRSGDQRGYLLPELPNIRGRTVLAATLIGHVGPGHVAQTYTLTPATARWSPGRITWSNQPGIRTAAAVDLAVGALADGATVEWDVKDHIQAVADGTAWYGWRLATSTATTGQRFYSRNSGEPSWELLIVLSDAPEQPSDLRPDGGAVPINEPIVAWAFVDLGGTSTTQADSQVQVDTPAAGAEPDEVAPDFDSGWVANVDPQYDLAAATYTPPVSPPGPTYWRVKVRDGDGNESEWSDWAEFTVDDHPTLVIDSPTGAFGDPSPQLLAHLTGGTVASWKAYATGPDRSDIRAASGVQTGAIDWQIPLRNSDGRRVFREAEAGWIYLRVWDTVDRAVAVGQKTYVDVWIPVDLTDDGALTAPTNLTVVQIADGDPRSTWTWERTEAADAWLIQVDGKTLVRLDPEDVTVDAGTYSWTDNGEVSPLRPHTLRVRAVEGSGVSPGASLTQTRVIEGVWLLPEDGDAIQLDGDVVEGFTRSDAVATYTLLTGEEVDIRYGTPPRIGAFEGSVDSRQDVWAALDAVEDLRRSHTRKVRMVWGSQSELGRIRHPDATSHGEILPSNLLHAVRFTFVGSD